MRFFYRDGVKIVNGEFVSGSTMYYERIEGDNVNHTVPIEVEIVNASVADGTGQVFNNQRDLMTASRYKADRRMEFPSIAEQLDSLYHEIIVSGSLTSSGSWAQSIRAVKDANPKPTGSA